MNIIFIRKEDGSKALDVILDGFDGLEPHLSKDEYLESYGITKDYGIIDTYDIYAKDNIIAFVTETTEIGNLDELLKLKVDEVSKGEKIKILWSSDYYLPEDLLSDSKMV